MELKWVNYNAYSSIPTLLVLTLSTFGPLENTNITVHSIDNFLTKCFLKKSSEPGTKSTKSSNTQKVLFYSKYIVT